MVVRAACPAAAYGFDVELVSVLATRLPTVACAQALKPFHTALCCYKHLILMGLFTIGTADAQLCTSRERLKSECKAIASACCEG